MAVTANSSPQADSASTIEVEVEAARLRRHSAVRRYMEGSIVHPGFLLPWEEERAGRNGRRYFVDLVTGEITWKEPKGRVTRLSSAERVTDSPKDGCSDEVRIRARALHVEYWRYYLTQRGALFRAHLAR